MNLTNVVNLFNLFNMIVASNDKKVCFARCPQDVIRAGLCSCSNWTLDKLKVIEKDKEVQEP